MDSQEVLTSRGEPIALSVGGLVIAAVVGLVLLKRLSIKVAA